MASSSSSSSQYPAAAPESDAANSSNPLATALRNLFLNVTSLVQGELQSTNSEYELLERMNLRVATEYENQADFAAGLRVFVERLKQKNDSFGDYLLQIDEIDQEVTELEALVSTLDNYTSNLEAKVKVAVADSSRQSV
jgi:biogenesis of lysosome-related organelles complex 1 subunit 2